MRIERVLSDDLPAVARLYSQFWGDGSDIDAMRSTLARLDGDPDYAILCARVDGSIVGAATGVVCHGLYGGADSYLVIEDLIVDADCRRSGVGSALLGELERFARERSCGQVILVTEASREDALSFYESSGFDSSAYRGFKKRLSAGVQQRHQPDRQTVD